MKQLYTLLALATLQTHCGPQSHVHSETQLESVDISQTPVQTQGRIGLCWAYATIGLVESVYKGNEGGNVDLSEEALAYHRLAHMLKHLFDRGDVNEILSLLARKYALPVGWHARMPTEYLVKLGESPEQLDALALIERYGVTPESAWSFKVPTHEAFENMMDGIAARTHKIWSERKTLKGLSLEEIGRDILVGPASFPSPPPKVFTFEGKDISPQQLLERTGFVPKDYQAVVAASGEDVDRLIQIMKQTLAQGISVPLGFSINIDRIKDDLFTGEGVAAQTWNDLVNFTRDGGHLVLATDFVNEGGKEGSMEPKQLQNELARPSSDLDYLVFKNSWGVGAKVNETGKPIGFSADGYYRMDYAYLQAAARVGEYPNWLPLSIVVPTKVLAK